MKHLSVLFALLISQVTFSQTVTLRDTTNQYDYIIITVPEFKAACEPFKQHKQNMFGFKVLIADTTMIYNEFNSYPNKEDNIREFVSYSGTYWRYPQPKYFLLAGDQGKIPNHSSEFIFGYYTDYFYSQNKYDPDTMKVDFFIGRVPAISTITLQNYFNKVITYDNNPNLLPWNNNALFVSEYDSSRIYQFDSIAQSISSQTASYINTKHFVMGNPSLPTFGNRDSVISFMNNDGCSSVWFIGRVQDQISFGVNRYFNISDIDLIQTSGKYFISLFGSYQQPAIDSIISLTDKFILNPDAALAGIGFTGLSFYQASIFILKEIVKQLYVNNSMGLAERINISAPLTSFTYYQRVILNLWGDPSLRIKFDPTTDIIEQNSELASTYSLYQNYPNPFNPSTKISFSLPVAGNVQIKIFDVLGNEVSLLADGFFEAGVHSIEFNAQRTSQDLSSGIYFYSIKNGENFQTKKMLYLK